MDFLQSLTSLNARDFVKDKLGNTPLHYAAENYPDMLISMVQKAQYLGKQIMMKNSTYNNI
jgi:ankyrin repeat protein